MSAKPHVPLVIVAAVGRNGAIGRGKRLPWSLPSDLAHFRACTIGKPMVMGRLTFEAIGRALPGRESIVVTGDPELALPPGVWRAASPDAALVLAGKRAVAMAANEIVLAGGATLFASLMNVTDRMRLTFVDLAPEADTFFPEISPATWRQVSRVAASPHPDDEAKCEFVDYARRDPRL